MAEQILLQSVTLKDNYKLYIKFPGIEEHLNMLLDGWNIFKENYQVASERDPVDIMRLRSLQFEITELKKEIDSSQATKDCALFMMLLNNTKFAKGETNSILVVNPDQKNQLLYRPKESRGEHSSSRDSSQPPTFQRPPTYIEKPKTSDVKEPVQNKANEEIKEIKPDQAKTTKHFEIKKEPKQEPIPINVSRKDDDKGDFSVEPPPFIIQPKVSQPDEIPPKVGDITHPKIEEPPKPKTNEILPPKIEEPQPKIEEPKPKVVEPPPKVVEQPPKVVEPPPKVVEPHPKVVEQPPKVVEPPPKVEEPQPKDEEIKDQPEEEESPEVKIAKANQEKWRNQLEVSYRKLYRKEKEFTEKSTLNIILNKLEGQNLLKDYSSLKGRLPNLHKLMIGFPDYLIEEFKQFILNSFPLKLDILIINGFSYINNKRGLVSEYSDILAHKLRDIKGEIHFIEQNMVSSSVFSHIVRSSLNTERLVFRGCEIPTDEECDFGYNVPYKIKYISFGYNGRSDVCKWRAKSERFENIIKGIANSSLKNSLTTIQIKKESMGLTSAETILKNHGLKHITIEKGYSEPQV